MKARMVAVLLLVGLVLSGSAAAQAVEKGAFGIGLILGEPTGVSAKLYLDDDNALQAAAGFAFIGGGLHVHADYLWHPWILEERDSFVLLAYVGPGVRFLYYNQGRDGPDFVALGARGVGGIVFDFNEIPLDVFAEIAGVVEWQFGEDPDSGVAVTLDAGAGARYYF